MPEISVILPVYHSAATLARCLSAVAAQSFSDYELLICDDGSGDGSAAICRGFAACDSRLRVLPLAHRGVSAARNAGLAQAKGAYIAFVDSDDAPAPHWLATLRKNAVPDGLSVCGYTANDPGGTPLSSTEDGNGEESCTMLLPLAFMEDIFSNRLLYQGYVWNKLFSRALLEQDPPLRFAEEVHYNEDRLFLFGYLWRCAIVHYTGSPQYSYTQRPPGDAYRPALCTELDAFETMCMALKGPNRRELATILSYAERDRFRAAAALYLLAGRNGAVEVLPRLGQEVLRYSSYLNQFEEYPSSVREAMARAVEYTRQWQARPYR